MPRTCAGGGGEWGECLRAPARGVHVCDLHARKCMSPTCGGAAPFPGTAPPPHLSLTARHCCRGKTSSMDGSATVGGASDPDAGRCTTIFSGCFCSGKGWGGKQGVLGSVAARCGAAQPGGPAAAPHGGPPHNPAVAAWAGLGRVAAAGGLTRISAVYSFSILSIRCSTHSSPSSRRACRLLDCRACARGRGASSVRGSQAGGMRVDRQAHSLAQREQHTHTHTQSKSSVRHPHACSTLRAGV
jgi:hypothetical protein